MWDIIGNLISMVCVNITQFYNTSIYGFILSIKPLFAELWITLGPIVDHLLTTFEPLELFSIIFFLPHSSID